MHDRREEDKIESKHRHQAKLHHGSNFQSTKMLRPGRGGGIRVMVKGTEVSKNAFFNNVLFACHPTCKVVCSAVAGIGIAFAYISENVKSCAKS